jgi:hypothetical protein
MTTPSKLEADSRAPEVSEKLPLDFFVPTLTAGTVDDNDSADERADKNANTAASEEFQDDDEDREGADE